MALDPDPVQNQTVEPVPIPPPPNPGKWFTYEDVAAYMRVTPRTVMAWVREGRIPSPVYMGHSARFTDATFGAIIAGIDPPGTHVVGKSPRRRIGKKGGHKKVKPKAKAKVKPKAKAKAKKGGVK